MVNVSEMQKERERLEARNRESGFVTVEEAADAPVSVQQSRRLLHVGD